ncbi:MAG: hypothetical protein RLZZ361_804 [Cyanobacteriota bacterium]
MLRAVEYQYTINYCSSNLWQPIPSDLTLESSELDMLGIERPESEAGPVSNLPVAYKQVGESFDQNKPTIVISHTEDHDLLLKNFCFFIDKFFMNP